MRRRHFGSATCSERVLDREVIEVAVFVLSRLLDELAGGEVAIAGVALDVMGEVVGGENVDLGAHVAGGGAGPRPQHATTLVVDRVMIGGPPEEILLERKREVADRADADAGVGTDEVLSPDVVDVPQVRVVVWVERVERSDVPSWPVVSARVVELKVDAGGQTRDRQRVAENGRERRSRDVSAAHRPELGRPLHFEVQARGADLAPDASAERMSMLPSDGAVECSGLVVGVQPVEVQVHGHDVKRPGAKDAEQLLVRGRLVEAVLVDHHGLRPEGGDRPARDLADRGAALEGTRDLREVPGPDQPLRTEDQLLTTTAQRHARLLAQRDHDVRETVHQVDLVDVRSRPSPRQVAVERERTPPLAEHAEVASKVEIGAQPVSSEEIAIGLLRLRDPELVLSEELPALAGLATD